MLDILLLTGFLAILGLGCLLWKILRKDHRAGLTEVPVRRREDARDWQRRFGAESLLTANFLQPTQNEILETLCVLDYLTPGWETAGDESVESHFLNELALNFPSLRKPQSAFPLPFAESLAAKSLIGVGKKKLPATEEEISARRESFRNERAQFNALEQIVAGASVGPVAATPGSLPFRVSAEDSASQVANPWPARFAMAAAIVAAFLGATYFFDHPPGLKVNRSPLVEPAASPAAVSVESAPEAAETLGPVAAASPTAAPASVVAAAPVTEPVARPLPVGPSAERIALNSRIAASQQRAVDKHPDLAIEGSEINLRFVFRYKNFVRENSSRLLDPNWPEELAEECAAAAVGAPSKHSGLTQITGTRR